VVGQPRPVLMRFRELGRVRRARRQKPSRTAADRSVHGLHGQASSSREKEHRAGGAFILRPHGPFVLGLAAVHVRSLGAGSTYSRSVLGEDGKLLTGRSPGKGRPSRESRSEREFPRRGSGQPREDGSDPARARQQDESAIVASNDGAKEGHASRPAQPCALTAVVDRTPPSSMPCRCQRAGSRPGSSRGPETP